MDFIDTTRVMTSSDHSRVLADQELALVHHRDNTCEVGWFCGPPHAALMTKDEQWAIIVGEGVLVVHMPGQSTLPQKELRFDTAQSLAGSPKAAHSTGGFPCLTRSLPAAVLDAHRQV